MAGDQLHYFYWGIVIRLATTQDLPWLVQSMLALKAQTGWSLYLQPGYNEESLARFLTQRLQDPLSLCVVWDPGDGPTAFCGGSLQSFVLPPYMPCVLEWGWGGPPKAAVKCWHAIVEWGLTHGAQLSGRVASQPGTSPQEIRETIIWKVLT